MSRPLLPAVLALSFALCPVVGRAQTAAAPASADDPAAACAEAANAVRAAVMGGRAVDLYGMLPPSWRSDLDARLRQFAGKIDRPFFDQFTALAGDLAALAEEKQELVLSWLEAEGAPFGEADLSSAIDALRLVSEWRFDDFANARWEALLGDPRASAFLTALLRANLRMRGLDLDPDDCFSEFSPDGPVRDGVVTLRFAYREVRYAWNEEGGEPARTVEEDEDTVGWTCVESCWVPDLFVHSQWRGDTWRGMMGELREEIGRLSPREFGEASMAATMLRLSLPALRRAETLREVESVLRGLD